MGNLEEGNHEREVKVQTPKSGINTPPTPTRFVNGGASQRGGKRNKNKGVKQCVWGGGGLRAAPKVAEANRSQREPGVQVQPEVDVLGTSQAGVGVEAEGHRDARPPRWAGSATSLAADTAGGGGRCPGRGRPQCAGATRQSDSDPDSG